ncbi:MAG: acyl carrier protein [Clostridiales bacterium]|nr:MAG: acyl carrier protein [Clostridiales bacterium]
MIDTRNIVNSIIMEKKFSETITAEMELKGDLGIDSLGLVELVVDLEERFNIEFDESDLDPANLKTVGSIYSLVDKYTEG